MLVVKTFLKKTKNKGIGLFAAEDIKKGTIVHIDENFLDREFSRKFVKKCKPLLREFIVKYGDYNSSSDSWSLSCDDARFMNHSETPNILWDSKKKTMFAIKSIKKGEEIVCDYRNICDECRDSGIGFEVKA